MVRTASRSTTARPSPKVATPVEWLDRTGIIAASLPQRRRSELESTVDVSAAPALNSQDPPRDMDVRPRSVVIHRRARVWMGTAAGVALLVIGWLGAGMFGVQEAADSAAPLEIRQNVAEQPGYVQPAAPPAAEQQVAPTPTGQPDVTLRKPVTSKTSTRSSAKPSVGPRDDLPAKAASRRSQSLDGVNRQVQNFVGPMMDALALHSRH